MTFVTGEKNKNIAPSDNDIEEAMKESGGKVTTIAGDNASKKVTFTGSINHTEFQNNLEKIAKGNKNSCNFVWADS